MAARAGVDPSDPEPQIAADALVSLWRIFYSSIIKYSHVGCPSRRLHDTSSATSSSRPTARHRAVVLCHRRPRGEPTRPVRAAADASNEARKQVLTAMKQARMAWRALQSEAGEHARDGADAARRARDDARAARERAHQVSREDAAEIRRQAHLMAQEIKDAARRSRRAGRSRPN